MIYWDLNRWACCSLFDRTPIHVQKSDGSAFVQMHWLVCLHLDLGLTLSTVAEVQAPRKQGFP